MSAIFDFDSFPRLETPRLILREATPGDAQDLFEFYRDPQMTRYVTFGVHRTIDDTLAFLAWMADAFQKKDSIRWGYELKETGNLIGSGGLHFWKRNIRCAEVGYHIGPPYWGGGYATEALRAIVAFGFEHMDLNRIEGKHTAGNVGSGRVMLKTGFRYEGTLRQREVKDGLIEDCLWYSILREEYEQPAG